MLEKVLNRTNILLILTPSFTTFNLTFLHFKDIFILSNTKKLKIKGGKKQSVYQNNVTKS